MKPITAIPQMLVQADGVPLPNDEAVTLVEIRVQQRLSLPALCELVFDNPPSTTLVPGSALRVSARGQSVPLFNGEVTAVEYVYEPAHGQVIRVRGYDPLHRLRKRQSVRAYADVTLQDLIQEFVADLGLTVQAVESGPRWHHLIQHRQSDFELLVELAERCGLYLSVRDSILHLLTLQGMGESLALALGDSLLEARIEVNGDPACRTVAASGWNPLRVETHQGSASIPRVGREVSAEVPPVDVGGSGERDLVDEIVQDVGHVEAIAQAELDLRAAREVTLWGIAEGDPRLRPGAIVEVNGVARSLKGQYVLTSVNHVVNQDSGFFSEISSAPLPLGERPRNALVTLGVVTQIDDPENLGRVRVSLPTYQDVETDWMGVLMVGAGANKGLMILPDVGDQVLLLFAHEDPAQGIVLGGLYGMQGTPDSGIQDGVVRRFTLRTPGGQRVQLDDSKKVIRLENSDGSYVELSPDKMRLHAAVGLDIEAPGQPIVIKGQTIDFQRG